MLFTTFSGEKREWDPKRSKLAAAIVCGMKNPIDKNSIILYLGASAGTTVSHVSDIAEDGIVYAIEFAERVFRPLLDMAGKRNNIVPILADARKPDDYFWIEAADIVFCDIAQPDETQIAIRNADIFLKKGGLLIISVKSQSIDVTKYPKQVYKEEADKLKRAGYFIHDLIDIEKYEKGHAVIVGRK